MVFHSGNWTIGIECPRRDFIWIEDLRGNQSKFCVPHFLHVAVIEEKQHKHTTMNNDPAIANVQALVSTNI